MSISCKDLYIKVSCLYVSNTHSRQFSKVALLGHDKVDIRDPTSSELNHTIHRKYKSLAIMEFYRRQFTLSLTQMKTFQTRYLQQQFFSSWLCTQLTYTLTGKRINLASINAVIRSVHSFSYLWCWPSWLRCYSHLLRYGPPTVLYLLLYYWSHATLWHMIIITSSKFHRKRMHL